MLFTEIPTEEQAHLVLKEALSHQVVAIDTETNGEDVYDGRGQCYGISIAYGDTAMYIPFRHTNCPEENFEIRDYLPALQAIIDTCTVVYHNSQFDIQSLSTLGLNARGKHFADTMVLAHLVDEVRPFGGKGLDACVKYYCIGVEGKKNAKDSAYSVFLKAFGYAELTASLTCEYAMWDAWITLQLYRALTPKLNAENLGPTWRHKSQVVDRLIAMKHWGVRVDTELCETMVRTGQEQMELLKASLKGRNPRSHNDLEALLIGELGLPIMKYTPAGKASFDKYAMEEYDIILERLNDPTAKSITQYRGWSGAISNNFDPYQRLLSPDGRLRTDYLLHGTKTGRLSSRHPNLQNIPKVGEKPWNGKMKQAFIPEDGYILLEGDYSQLEFRLAAAFAKEHILLEAFADPTRDVFDEMAELLGMERQDCKTLTYSIMYGAGLLRIMNVFGVTEEHAREIRDRFYRIYKKIFLASKRAAAHVIKYGKIPMWTDRYRHFLYPKNESHKAYNSICQGGGADIVERTMLRCAANGLDTNDCRMLLQVHDSLVFEVRADLVGLYRPKIQTVMEAVPEPFGVPFKVDVHQWGLAA